MPKNPQKYVGDVRKVFWRSSWELRLMKWLDMNNAVIRWNSESLAIPYVHPFLTDASGRPKIYRYFPDFVITYQDTAGQVHTEIVEVKPYKESVLSPGMSEQLKMTYAVNQAKWKAAAAFAESQGAKFRVVTEHSLFLKKIPKGRGKVI